MKILKGYPCHSLAISGQHSSVQEMINMEVVSIAIQSGLVKFTLEGSQAPTTKAELRRGRSYCKQMVRVVLHKTRSVLIVQT